MRARKSRPYAVQRMGITKTEHPYRTTIIRCPHCGLDHSNVLGKLYLMPMLDESDGIPWTRFATCCVTGKPIPIKVIYDNGHYYPDLS